MGHVPLHPCLLYHCAEHPHSSMSAVRKTLMCSSQNLIMASSFFTLSCSGLLMGTLDGSIFWEKSFSNDSFTPRLLHPLPEGPCTCLSFEPVTRHCLASFRPSKRTPHSRHIVRCTLSSFRQSWGPGIPFFPTNIWPTRLDTVPLILREMKGDNV